jgi:hypothetical protein
MECECNDEMYCKDVSLFYGSVPKKVERNIHVCVVILILAVGYTYTCIVEVMTAFVFHTEQGLRCTSAPHNPEMEFLNSIFNRGF